jgi:4-oxalocrotonate tautomerase
MPIVNISLYAGRTQREKDRLAEAITDDICRILDVRKEAVIVVFDEHPRGNWYAEGRRL